MYVDLNNMKIIIDTSITQFGEEFKSKQYELWKAILKDQKDSEVRKFI